MELGTLLSLNVTSSNLALFFLKVSKENFSETVVKQIIPRA